MIHGPKRLSTLRDGECEEMDLEPHIVHGKMIHKRISAGGIYLMRDDAEKAICL